MREPSLFQSFESVLHRSPVELATGRRLARYHVTAEPPVTEQDVASAERSLGHRLPADLQAFVLHWNGARLLAAEEGTNSLQPNPSLYSVERITKEQDPFNDPRVLIIGQSDD